MGTSTHGHVFVVHGNITTLAVDAWILPTDREAHINPSFWGVTGSPNGERRTEFSEEFRAGTKFAEVLPWASPTAPVPICTAVPLAGVTSAASIRPRLQAGLGLAVEEARNRAGSHAIRIAMPTFGTRGGGGGALSGELLRAYLELAHECSQQDGVDVVIACLDRRSFTGLQILRCAEDAHSWVSLSPDKQAAARTLAGRARDGELTPFMGAGVSVTSGLPDWESLLEQLRQTASINDVSAERFAELSTLDQADLLASVLGPDLKSKIAKATTPSKTGLPPLLLASLNTREAVTLNYDQLFEQARRTQGGELTVLPGARVQAHTPWLLKLHGSTDRESDIVLTRQDYLAYAESRSALSSLATALLMTRHLLFAGFGFSDDHFHKLLHDVRSVYSRGGEDSKSMEAPRLGTALMLGHDTVRERLWRDHLDIITFAEDATTAEQGRRLEIFLDMLAAHTVNTPVYFLDSGYVGLLNEDEVELAGSVTELMARLEQLSVHPTVRDVFRRLNQDLGGRTRL